MNQKPYFPFYNNWVDMIAEVAAEDVESAKTLAYAIIMYEYDGTLIDLGSPLANAQFKGTLIPALHSAEKHYEDGARGGRPNKLTDDDQHIIAEMRQEHKTSKEIAKCFGVSDDTIQRSYGWKNYKEFAAAKTAKTAKPQNQKEKEKEEEYKEEKPVFRPSVEEGFDKWRHAFGM